MRGVFLEVRTQNLSKNVEEISSLQQSKVNQTLYMPWGLQEVEVTRFQDNRHMKVVRLSALRTGHLYPSGNIPVTHFC